MTSASTQSAIDRIGQALRDRVPLGLLLGQDAWSKPEEPDRVLTLALQRLDQTSREASGWAALLQAPSDQLSFDFLGWLSEKYARRARPPWIERIPEMPWSVIATSSVDQTLRFDMRVGAREPTLVLTGIETPIVARSLARPPLYYLYGLATETDPMTRPPTTRAELRSRQQRHASPMLNHVVEAVTSVGLLLIDGYTPSRDWLQLDAVLSAIEALPKAHVIWFGINEHAAAHDDLRHVFVERNVTVVEHRLGDVLEELELIGIRLDELASSIAQPTAVSLSGKDRRSFVPPPELRIRVEAAAAIVDDSWTTFLPPLTPADEYVRFRRFHGNLTTPKEYSEGIRRDFTIVRDVEGRLQATTFRAIDERAAANEPIVISGQSGSGKSVALARLISLVRDKARAAVLYARTRLPNDVEIDDFCVLADNHGASATVIVCDLNLPIRRYRDLLIGLRTRGRKVVVVGSTYALRRIAASSYLVKVPPKLSKDEDRKLEELLSRFDLLPTDNAVNDPEQQYILARLYRRLPSARPQLVSGLSQEARRQEEQFREHARTPIRRTRPRTQLAQQIIDAGLALDTAPMFDDLADDELAGANDSASRIIDLVMVAGQLGCAVPVNLLMRAVSPDGAIEYELFSRLFDAIDLLRLEESGDGEDLLVGPRLRREAEMLCRARLGDARAYSPLLVSLISAARLSWDAGGGERRFVIDLVQRLGPDGPERNRFRDSYLDVANALRDIRLRRGISDLSLVLQESVLTREAVRFDLLNGASAESVLLSAESAIAAALDELEQSDRRRGRRQQMRLNLLVERATLYGFLSVQKAKAGASEEHVLQMYQAARTAATEASGMTSTYYPRDVRLWLPADLIKQLHFSEVTTDDLRADIEEVLDEVDVDDLPPDQAVNYNKRRQKVADVIGDQGLSDEAFSMLADAGSTSGYYLRARSTLPSSSEVANGNSSVSARAQLTAAFLQEHWAKIKSDERCVRLLFRARWLASTAQFPISISRSSLPYERNVRYELYDLARSINSLSSYRDNIFRYFEATLAWCIDLDRDANNLFADLSRESEYVDPRRLARRHILTDVDGRPQVFSGRLDSQRDPERFDLRVDGLNKSITLRVRNFPQYELRYGAPISRFAITFDFIGPIADPIR